LNAIGFVWETDIRNPTFEDRLEECREFRRQHNHLTIPPPVPKKEEDESTYGSPEEKSLRWWAERQRQAYRRFNAGVPSKLNKTRIKKLDEIGFDWDAKTECKGPGHKGRVKNDDLYNERLEELKKVKGKYGNINDISNLKKAGFGTDSTLYQWIRAQRKGFKALKAGKWSALSPDRIAKLEELGFDFEPRKDYPSYGSKKSAAKKQAAEPGGSESDSEEEQEEEEEEESPRHGAYATDALFR
jgi:hypothetical protein